MATQYKPQSTSGSLNGSENGPLTRGQPDRFAAVAFRRLWMRAIGAGEDEIREACDELADGICYDEKLENPPRYVEAIRKKLEGASDTH